ncbi:MAG: YibE/F family protein [Patescibacteria group bacterium]
MNKIIFKTILTVVGLTFLFIPAISRADQAANEPETFKAKVIEVMAVKEITREDGSKFKQQNLKLQGLEGKWKGKEIIYNGISDIEVADAGFYKTGDKVFVEGYTDESGEMVYYVVDFVRSGYIYLLTAIFVIMTLLVGRFKGFKALLSLFASFIIIIKFILPQILAGRDPFLISLIGSLVILAIIIYLTEGFNKKSHLAVLSVLISLFVTLILSVIFADLTRLTGFSQEESAFLIGVGQAVINFKGLLLAGFIIGAVGVLDDIIIGQIEAVEQIKEANPNLPSGKVFILAYRVGNAHLGAIINTLFLTYVGASLPLLLLFVLNTNGVTFSRLINTEIVSTEIVRTLVGSIGVILSMPIATFLASLKSKKSITK